MDLQFRSLTIECLNEIELLLRRNQLPFEDCVEHLNNFIGVKVRNRLVAVGGYQLVGHYALLRSCAVTSDYKGKGIGAEIVKQLLTRLKSLGIDQVYLLTESAECYFERFGFQTIERDLVPNVIRSTKQFDSLCPSTASVMQLQY